MKKTTMLIITYITMFLLLSGCMTNNSTDIPQPTGSNMPGVTGTPEPTPAQTPMPTMTPAAIPTTTPSTSPLQNEQNKLFVFSEDTFSGLHGIELGDKSNDVEKAFGQPISKEFDYCEAYGDYLVYTYDFGTIEFCQAKVNGKENYYVYAVFIYGTGCEGFRGIDIGNTAQEVIDKLGYPQECFTNKMTKGSYTVYQDNEKSAYVIYKDKKIDFITMNLKDSLITIAINFKDEIVDYIVYIAQMN